MQNSMQIKCMLYTYIYAHTFMFYIQNMNIAHMYTASTNRGHSLYCLYLTVQWLLLLNFLFLVNFLPH